MWIENDKKMYKQLAIISMRHLEKNPTSFIKFKAWLYFNFMIKVDNVKTV